MLDLARIILRRVRISGGFGRDFCGEHARGDITVEVGGFWILDFEF